MIRNIWASNCSEIDGVKSAEVIKAIARHHRTRCQIRLAAPVERVPVKLKAETRRRGLEHANALGYYLVANAITCKDCDRESFQRDLPVHQNSVVMANDTVNRQ